MIGDAPQRSLPSAVVGAGTRSPGRRAVVVEITPDHGFTVFPQCVFLHDAGWEVEVVINRRNLDLDLLQLLPREIRRREVTPGRGLGWFQAYRAVARSGAEFVALNTPLGRAAALWAGALPVPPRVVIHNLDRGLECRGAIGRRLEGRVLRRAPRVFVLSELLRPNVTRYLPAVEESRVGVFLPSFFPGVLAAETPLETLTDTSRPLRFVVPGSLRQRRNYQGLVRMVGNDVIPSWAAGLRLHLLGDPSGQMGEWLADLDAGSGSSTTRLVFEPAGRVAAWRFVHQLESAHFAVPLIDRSVFVEKPYGRTVAASSLMWARAFAVPLVCSRDLVVDPELRPFTVFYDGDRLEDGLYRAAAMVVNGSYRELRQRFRAARAGWFERSRDEYLA